MAATTRRRRPSARNTASRSYKFDVGDFKQCQDAIKKITAELGPVDIVVNNAGITRDGTLHKMSAGDVGRR